MWLVPFAAIAYTVGNVGGVGAWLSGPARIAFVIGLDKYFPPAFGQVHPKWGTPWVAILVQAGLATAALLLSVLGKGTTVETVYLILLDTTLLLYFIPFAYLFASYFVLKRREQGSVPVRTAVVSLCGAGVTIFATVIAMIPPSGTAHPVVFFVKVAGGAAAFLAFGGALYWRANRRELPRGA